MHEYAIGSLCMEGWMPLGIENKINPRSYFHTHSHLNSNVEFNWVDREGIHF